VKRRLKWTPLLLSLLVWAGHGSSPWIERGAAFEPIASQPLDGMLCLMPGPTARGTSVGGAAPDAPLGGDIAPVRVVRDRYPVPAALAVDPINNVVVVSDENQFSLRLYDRTADQVGVAEARRVLSGVKTDIHFVCGVAVDPARKEMYSVNNDSLSRLVVFSYDQTGNVAPIREIETGKAWGLFLDKEHAELALANQHENRILFFRQMATGEEAPLRVIQGLTTGLADPHGIYVDVKHDEVVVSNYGSWSLRDEERSSRAPQMAFSSGERPAGRFELPSIRVYPRTGNGDVPPLRTIQGKQTRLNLPGGVWVDAQRNEILVANDGGHSILVFDRNADGDVAPIRTIEGAATTLRNPTGVVVDAVNDELWVSNWGDHAATVYPRTARGNVKPLRTIRTAPKGSPTPGLGNPSAVTYDSTREQILVPN
jgi:DNA-binding beta-propeller fold protein YncE